MAIEIERKFLVSNDQWREQAETQVFYSQGYMTQGGLQASVRIRVAGEKAWLNIKSVTLGVTRTEFEYPIPLYDAEVMLADLCLKPLVSKTRFTLTIGQHVWEIDEFEGENKGLIIAEIELADENENFVRPDWLGKEVSDEPRYYNTNLVQHPFQVWKDET